MRGEGDLVNGDQVAVAFVEPSDFEHGVWLIIRDWVGFGSAALISLDFPLLFAHNGTQESAWH
jgi:hypothetical protein